jgi:hypothetical protein
VNNLRRSYHPARNLFALFALIFTVSAAPVLWNGNGHYYELVPGNIIWDEARTAAELRSFNGLPGHLATVTSSDENGFIAGNFAISEGARFVWIAGREPADDGVWIWDAGAEAGTQFANGRSATPPYLFANWGGIEPNDFQQGEDYLMMNVGIEFAGIRTGEWADAIAVPNPSDPVLGYIVEYEPEPGPRISIKLLDSERLEISFSSIATRRYQLQSLADLTSNNWSNLGEPTTGDGTVIRLLLRMEAAKRFYRVQVFAP